MIGAGPSGILAVMKLLDAGFTNIVCLDGNEAVGGNGADLTPVASV